MGMESLGESTSPPKMESRLVRSPGISHKKLLPSRTLSSGLSSEPRLVTAGTLDAEVLKGGTLEASAVSMQSTSLVVESKRCLFGAG